MSRCRMFLKSQSGQSELLALAVASAIGAIVITATTQSFVQMNKGQKGIEQTAAALDIKRDLEQMLSDPLVCKANFGMGGINPHGFAADDIKRIDDLVQVGNIGIGTQLPGFNVTIDGWSLSNGITIKETAPAYQVVLLNLFISKGDVEGPKQIVRTIKLWTEKNSGTGSPIRNCHALIGGGNDIWIRDAVGNNIFNSNEDNVGVGTDTPLEKLHVFGTTPATGNMKTSGPVTADNFFAQGNYSSTNPLSFHFVGGSVGFGTSAPTEAMDVNGDAYFDGNLTIGQALTASDVVLGRNLVVGTDLTVAGDTTLGALTTYGNSNFNNTSTFHGDTQIDGVTTMAQTLAIKSSAPPAGFELGVNGNMMTNSSVTVPRVNANRFCIGPNCRTTFATQTCPAGSVTYRNLVNGTIECTNITCPNGTFFQGLSGLNSPICRSLPTPTCPTNSYVTDYDAVTGVYTCKPIPPEVFVPTCGPNQYLISVSAGVPLCAPSKLVGGICGVGKAVTQINSDGTVVCQDVFRIATPCSTGQIATGLNANGTLICESTATAGSCSGNRNRMVSVGSNRQPVCGSVAVTGGSCSTGIKGVSSSGGVSCF